MQRMNGFAREGAGCDAVEGRIPSHGDGSLSSTGSVPGLPGRGSRLQIATMTVLKYGAQENVTLHGVWMQGCPRDQGRPWPEFNFFTMRKFHSDKRTI